MHAARCPQCGSVLSMDRPLVKERVQCAGCGASFVATTKWVERKAAGHATAGTHRLYQRTRKPPTPPWVVIVVAVGGIALIGVFIALLAFGGKQQVAITDPSGQVVHKGRYTKEEAAALQKEVNEDYRQRRQRAMAQAEQAAEHREQAARARTAGQAGTPERTSPPGVSLPPGDANLIAVSRHVLADGRLWAVGTVRNTGGKPLRTATVHLVSTTAGGQIIARTDRSVPYLPPNGRAPFSVELTRLQQPVDFEPPHTSVSIGKTESDLLCWPVNESSCRYRIEGSRFILTGQTRNETGKTATDVKVYCDFLDDQGVIVGSATGTLNEGLTGIPAGRSASFTIEFDPSQYQRLPHVIQRWAPRVVGRAR